MTIMQQKNADYMPWSSGDGVDEEWSMVNGQW